MTTIFLCLQEPWSFCVFFSSQLFSLLVCLLSYFRMCIYPVLKDSHFPYYNTSSSNITCTLFLKILSSWLFTSFDNTKFRLFSPSEIHRILSLKNPLTHPIWKKKLIYMNFLYVQMQFQANEFLEMFYFSSQQKSSLWQ